MLERITLTNFLSFGPNSHTIDLKGLNVLIGPNGSGKSNLVEAFSVLRAVPRDLPLPIRQGGGVREWLWRGDSACAADSATIEILFSEGQIVRSHGEPRVRYQVSFGSEGGQFVVLDERIENETGNPRPFFLFWLRKWSSHVE